MKLPVILKNKYVLYVVLFFAITNVLGFLQRRDFESLTIFVAIGVLSTYFSKNMVVNLLVAIVGSNVIRGSGLVREGMVGKKDKKKGKKKGKKKEEEESDSEDEPDDPETKPRSSDRVAAKLGLGKTCKIGTECTSGNCSNNKCVAGKSKSAFTQRNVPSSRPASVNPASESEEDEAVGNRIDYAATLEQAYDNLEKMLGSDGLKGLTNETKQLVGQQQNLMKTLNNMAPVLNNAKETLGNLNLPDMGQVKELMETLQGPKK